VFSGFVGPRPGSALPRFVGLRLTPAAYRHGLALALPEKVEMPPDRCWTRDYNLQHADAAELVGIRPSTAKPHLADLRVRSGFTTEQLIYAGRAEGWLDVPSLEPR
jgi:hypothetical protein